MANFVTDYIVLPIGIATIVIAVSGTIYGAVRLWRVDDNDENGINRGRWDWRWWRWWIMSM